MKHEEIRVINTLQGVFCSYELKQILQKQHHIFSKAIGINKQTKNLIDFLIGPFLIDCFAVCFLYEMKICNFVLSQQLDLVLQKKIGQDWYYHIYKKLLTNRKMFLLDGHKFGSQFLAYTSNPDQNHAKYLIFCEKKFSFDKQIKQQEISRLCGICKKQGLIVQYTKSSNSQCYSIQFQQIQPKSKLKKRQNK